MKNREHFEADLLALMGKYGIHHAGIVLRAGEGEDGHDLECLGFANSTHALDAGYGEVLPAFLEEFMVATADRMYEAARAAAERILGEKHGD